MTDTISDTKPADPAAQAPQTDEMPPDEPEEGEDLVTEIPVHGVATVEGRATGDARGFRAGALQISDLPQPLGFMFETSHGGGSDRVSVIGRVDSYERVDVGDGVSEIRWDGVVMPGKPYAGQALDGIIDGSYTSLSVIVDEVTEDLADAKQHLLAQLSSKPAEDKSFEDMTPEELEAFVDEMLGDGKPETRWFSEGRVRRFDMVPTGAFIEGWTALGSWADVPSTPESVTAAAQALADCGCLESIGVELGADMSDFAMEDLSGDPVVDARNMALAIHASAFKDYPAADRKKMADSGNAMPDGSFPIANEDDLKNAIQSIGRAKDPAKAKAHIKKRASALGKSDLVPDDWAAAGEAFVHTFYTSDDVIDLATVYDVDDLTRDQYADAFVEEGFTLASPAAVSSAIARSGATVAMAPGTHDGPGWITHPIPTARIRDYWTKPGHAGYAKIGWGTGGDFNRCRMHLAKYVANPDWLAGMCANMHKEALGIWPATHAKIDKGHSLTASLFTLVAAPAPVSADYFKRPAKLDDGPVGVVIDGDHFYGYVALWNVCHVGQPEGPNTCTLAPHSSSNYAFYRTGTVMTDEGPVPVGPITMGTGHAEDGGPEMVSHYDNTGTVVGDVATGEDFQGIWYSGRLRPSATDDQIYALSASGRLSGDWRYQQGYGFELMAALVVNVPGFPIPQLALTASAAGITRIVAAGIVPFDIDHVVVEEAGQPVVLTADLVAGIAVGAVEVYVLEQERKATERELAPVRAALEEFEFTDARRRLTTFGRA